MYVCNAHMCVGNPFLNASAVYEVAWGLKDWELNLFLLIWHKQFFFSFNLSPKYMSKEVVENE